MAQNNFTLTEKKELLQQNKFKLIVLLIVFSFSTIFGQSITSVSPNSAAQGTTDLLVTFILDGGSTEMPPADAPVDQVTIGTIKAHHLPIMIL